MSRGITPIRPIQVTNFMNVTFKCRLAVKFTAYFEENAVQATVTTQITQIITSGTLKMNL